MRYWLTGLFITLSMQANAACLPTDLCARITGLADQPLGAWGGSGAMTSTYTLCAYVQNDNDQIIIPTKFNQLGIMNAKVYDTSNPNQPN